MGLAFRRLEVQEFKMLLGLHFIGGAVLHFRIFC